MDSRSLHHIICSRNTDYAALGRAVLRAHEFELIKDFVPPMDNQKGGASRLGHDGNARLSIVLIDEIDKAPRDFSNDLLDELENLRFRVPELKEGYTPELPRSMRPVILITSNSERQLPEAFVRRCLYFHIPFPESGATHDYNMENIVARRLGEDYSKTVMVADSLKLFYALRHADQRLRKHPATAELLNWLIAMRASGADANKPLGDQKNIALATIAALLKNNDDRQQGYRFIEKRLEG